MNIGAGTGKLLNRIRWIAMAGQPPCIGQIHFHVEADEKQEGEYGVKEVARSHWLQEYEVEVLWVNRVELGMRLNQQPKLM